MVSFYYNELFCVIAKKPNWYFNVCLKSVLFLSLFGANVAILQKPSSRFTMKYCGKKMPAEKYFNCSDTMNRHLSLKYHFFHRCFLAYFADENQSP